MSGPDITVDDDGTIRLHDVRVGAVSVTGGLGAIPRDALRARLAAPSVPQLPEGLTAEALHLVADRLWAGAGDEPTLDLVSVIRGWAAALDASGAETTPAHPAAAPGEA